MKKAVKTILAASITLALTACGGFSNSSPEIVVPVTPTTLSLSGDAVKGTLAFATVQAYAAQDLTTEIAEPVQTDVNGDYTLTLTDVSGDPITGAVVVIITADDDTTMICDAAVACGDVARGDAIQAIDLAGLSLSTFTYADSGTGDISNVKVSALSTMATNAILASAAENDAIELGNLTAESVAELQVSGSEIVGAILGLDLMDINLYSLNIADASDSSNVPTDDINASTLSFINASLSNLTIADGEVLGNVLATYFDNTRVISAAVIANVNVDLAADFSDAVANIALVQSQISMETALIKTQVEQDSGVVITTQLVSDTVDPTEIGKAIGEIISGTGGTGLTGGS